MFLIHPDWGVCKRPPVPCVTVLNASKGCRVRYTSGNLDTRMAQFRVSQRAFSIALTDAPSVELTPQTYPEFGRELFTHMDPYAPPINPPVAPELCRNWRYIAFLLLPINLLFFIFRDESLGPPKKTNQHQGQRRMVVLDTRGR